MLLLLTSIYFVFLTGIFLHARKFEQSIFEPVTLACVFYFVEGAVLLWFAIVPGAIERSIFSFVVPKFREFDFVVFHYFFSLFAVIFLILGTYVGAYSRGPTKRLLSGFLRRVPVHFEEGRLAVGYLLFISGVLCYLILMSYVGGLEAIWSQLSLKTEAVAGLGYLNNLFQFLTVVGTATLSIKFHQRRSYVKLVVLVLLAMFLLGSMGARGPLVFMLFVLLVVYNFKVRRIRWIEAKHIALTLVLAVFMLVSVQFRSSEVKRFSDITFESLAEDIEFSLLRRATDIERGVVAIGYFEEREYWGFGLYESVVYAAIPRGFFPDKPPVDTGRYLATIGLVGRVGEPPQPTGALVRSSWPDNFYAGYMSFGPLGLIGLCFLSGWLYGFSFHLVRQNGYGVLPIYFFATLGFFGVRILSPLNIVVTLISIVYISIVALLFGARFRASSRSRVPRVGTSQ